MILKIKTSILFFLLASMWLGAQEVWTLDACIDYALSNNLQLKNNEFTEASQKETYRQSVRNLLPTINASAEYNIRYGRSVNPNNNDIINSDFFSNTYGIHSSLDIFQGFQKLNSIKASKYLYEASMNDVQQQKYLLAFSVMQAFYDIKFYEGLVANSKEQVKISETNFKNIQKQIELGLKAGADVYEAEAALLGDQLLLTQNSNLLKAAELVLVQTMNLENAQKITLIEDFEITSVASETINSTDVYTTAKTFIPTLKAEEFRAKAAKKAVAAARGNFYPSLSIFAGYGTGYFETSVDNLNVVIPFKNQIDINASRYIGASLIIPISNAWSVRSNVKQQKLAFKQAKNNVDIQEQELFKLIEQLVQEHNALLVEVDQSAAKVKAQEQAFSVAQKKYDKGLFSPLELMQAKNLYGVAQNENLQVQLRLKVNQKTLDFYQGLPIFSTKN